MLDKKKVHKISNIITLHDSINHKGTMLHTVRKIASTVFYT